MKFADPREEILYKNKHSATGSNIQEVPEEIAQGLVDYTIDPTKVSSLRGNQRMMAIKAAKDLDPTFDMKEFPARSAFVKDLNSGNGKMFQQVTSANTLIGHLGFMNQKIDELKNKNLSPANTVINLAKELSGDPTITNYTQASAVVDSELDRLLTGVGVTQEGMNFRRTLLSKNSGYKQQKEAVKTLVSILESRAGALEKQYKRVLKKDAGDNILFPESRETIKSIRGEQKNTLKEGTVEDGYKFKGGDPANSKNWEKI
jgi:hypothetical protein